MGEVPPEIPPPTEGPTTPELAPHAQMNDQQAILLGSTTLERNPIESGPVTGGKEAVEQQESTPAPFDAAQLIGKGLLTRMQGVQAHEDTKFSTQIEQQDGETNPQPTSNVTTNMPDETASTKQGAQQETGVPTVLESPVLPESPAGPPEVPPKPLEGRTPEEDRAGLVVRFKDYQFHTIRLEELPDRLEDVDQKIERIFHQLNLELPEAVAQDTTRTITQKYLDQITDAVDQNSINYDTFSKAFSELRQGRLPDTKNWEQLEFFRNAIEDVFDGRTTFMKGGTRETYFQDYFQNLKDKGADYEQLVESYLQEHSSMNVAEAHAIFSYTTISVYRVLNRMMREGTNPELTKEFTNLLESALSHMPVDTRLQYRAINISGDQLAEFLQEYASDNTVEAKQFISAAPYPVEPLWGQGNVHLIIEPTEARTITDLALGTHYLEILFKDRTNDTAETLFSHTAKFKVGNVDEQNGVYTIKLRQIA